MADVIVKLEGGKAFKKWLSSGAPSKPLDDFFDRSSVYIQQEAVKRAPTDTGRLRGSIQIRRRKDYREIDAKASYAGKVESGARPRWYPAGTLQPWASRHGFPSGAQGDFLARFGIANPKAQSKSRDGQPYMRPAFDIFLGRKLDFELKRLSKSIGATFKKSGVRI